MAIILATSASLTSAGVGGGAADAAGAGVAPLLDSLVSILLSEADLEGKCFMVNYIISKFSLEA